MSAPNRPEDVWKRIAIGAPDECWPWTARPRSKNGYGSMRISQRQILAHRIVYELATGNDPGELLVMHSCDNPPCCNPAHLSLGTVADNNREAKERGLQVNLRGERHGEAKLTDDDVRAIRARSANGEGRCAVARAFGVSPSRITQLVLYPDRHWSHV